MNHPTFVAILHFTFLTSSQCEGVCMKSLTCYSGGTALCFCFTMKVLLLAVKWEAHCTLKSTVEPQRINEVLFILTCYKWSQRSHKTGYDHCYHDHACFTRLNISPSSCQSRPKWVVCTGWGSSPWVPLLQHVIPQQWRHQQTTEHHYGFLSNVPPWEYSCPWLWKSPGCHKLT